MRRSTSTALTARALSRSFHNRSTAFTLIELIVVVIVIGILLAVALPSFFGASKMAHDATSKTYLTIAYRVAGETAARNSGVYPAASDVASAIAASEPELTVALGTCGDTQATTDSRFIYVDPASADGDFVAYSKSASGTVWQLNAPADAQETISATDCTAGDGTGSGDPVSLPSSPIGAQVADSVTQVYAVSADGSTAAWQDADYSSIDVAAGDGSGVRNYQLPQPDIAMVTQMFVGNGVIYAEYFDGSFGDHLVQLDLGSGTWSAASSVPAPATTDANGTSYSTQYDGDGNPYVQADTSGGSTSAITAGFAPEVGGSWLYFKFGQGLYRTAIH